MTINLKFKSLIAAIILSSFSSFAAVSAQENNDNAPEATAADAAISFWDLPYLEKAFIDTTPAAREDGIVVGELGVDGGEKAAIAQLAQEVADKKYGLYDSLLITHKGKLLFESYYLRGRVNLPHFQASATKSYTSLALGRAIQLGYLAMTDLNKPLISFLKDLDTTRLVDGAEKITLHKASTMRSGIRISDDKRSELNENPGPLKGQGLVQAWLEHSAPITAESQSYLYSWDQDLVMQVIEAVVPGTAQNFIKNELLNKIGITNYSWRDGVSGLPSAGAGTSMTSRDMLKLGHLVINKGKWNGEQLIPIEYLAKATSGITKAAAEWQPETYRYGYFWYQTNITAGDKSYDVKLAWGGGGQRIIVVKDLDLTIVITGHDRDDETIMPQILNTIVPAFAE
ncbi:serine hydrolase domain-containing protein [Kordiimonas aquimaris]|uniref:serine hydrolase domain-containing protein n=1 Tax=Kordiimonas aquimaris TaxID=707591 RepID=UPI0021D23CF8|nr:serine hydrolase [Kordiimonas aquimaris]